MFSTIGKPHSVQIDWLIIGRRLVQCFQITQRQSERAKFALNAHHHTIGIVNFFQRRNGYSISGADWRSLFLGFIHYSLERKCQALFKMVVPGFHLPQFILNVNVGQNGIDRPPRFA